MFLNYILHVLIMQILPIGETKMGTYIGMEI